MELFWELASTIALSLLLPLIFIKILSVPPNSQKNEKMSVIECDHNHDHEDQDHDHVHVHDQGVKPDPQRWETEEVVGIVRKFDEFRKLSVPGEIVVHEIVDARCGSPEILTTQKIDDDNRARDEIEVADLAESPVEETCGDCAVEEQERKEEIKISEVVGEGFRAQKVEETEIPRFAENCDEIDESMRNEEEIDEDKGLLLDEEDWEGVERTELEKRFGDAVVFFGSKINADVVDASLSNEVKMKLYGYHRIATQGPCREPQPMPLKFSARAKWNAWQQLGIMSPEMAMEQYISLLSDNIPHWVADSPDENAKSDSSADPAAKLTS